MGVDQRAELVPCRWQLLVFLAVVPAQRSVKECFAPSRGTFTIGCCLRKTTHGLTKLLPNVRSFVCWMSNTFVWLCVTFPKTTHVNDSKRSQVRHKFHLTMCGNMCPVLRSPSNLHPVSCNGCQI